MFNVPEHPHLAVLSSERHITNAHALRLRLRPSLQLGERLSQWLKTNETRCREIRTDIPSKLAYVCSNIYDRLNWQVPQPQ